MSSQTDSAAATGRNGKSAARTEPLTVFLLDDAPALREVTKIGLETEGDIVVVGEADDPVAGLPVIEREQPDAILLDLSMPRMDGFEAIPEIRRTCPHAAIIVFSAFAQSRIRDGAAALGAHGFVEKGAPIGELRRVLRDSMLEVFVEDL